MNWFKIETIRGDKEHQYVGSSEETLDSFAQKVQSGDQGLDGMGQEPRPFGPHQSQDSDLGHAVPRRPARDSQSVERTHLVRSKRRST